MAGAGAPDLTVVHAPSEVDAATVSRAEGAVLVLGPDREVDLIAALEAGATGYLLAGATTTEVAAAAQSVVAGTAVVPPLMLGGLLRHVVERRRRLDRAAGVLATLTPRELEVLGCAAVGLRRAEIAQQLFIATDTVRTHLQRIMSKLGVHSQPELVALAAQLGLPADTGEGS